jgi:DNA polymerase-1|tara:strand:+ start:1385 stop:1906 length:522 start_codon:yes stop_codon:yes gene_type:complete
MTELLFDIESTGLLRRGSTIHCIVARDMDKVEEAQVFDYKPERAVEQGIKQLEAADVLIGHNIINYDIPLIKEQFPDFTPRGKMLDTLVLSRLYYPHIADRDFQRRPQGMPQRLYGRHSLEAWGHRLKCFKGDFGKHEGSWEKYTPEMLDYCIQDTMVTVRLYELLQRRMNDA